jgi:ubiquinone/menaquinone biosynthesis C-methylase UbiE
MVPYELYRILQCPTCCSRDLVVTDDGVSCGACRSDYPRCDGYLDLMPRAVEFDYVSKYVAEEEQLAEELDYRDLAPPLLAAGVRNRALVRFLQLRPDDVVLDNACGTGKFAAWNADKVRFVVGSDPATLFADAAVQDVALAKADSRRLPFADNSFDKAFSIDVLEHFPRDVIDTYLAETARVLKPGGRFLAFSNTSDPSSLQPLVNLSRRLGKVFVRIGLYDFQREARRKSDHIKALATWDDVLDAMRQAGLRPVKIVFWNSVFTTFVEHVLMKLGEVVLGRQKDGGRRTEDGGRGIGDRGRGTGDGGRTTDENQTTTHHAPRTTHHVTRNTHDGAEREIRARRRMRARLTTRGPVYYALLAVTLLMELDLWLFGHLRSGSYFIVVEKDVSDGTTDISSVA